MRVASTVLVAFGLAFAISPAPAIGAEHVLRPDHPGQPYYRRYCGACHGVFADGKGPLVPVLVTPPPDLTRLSEKYGDPLSHEAVRDLIDGRNMARSHGRTDMPVWGTELRREGIPSKTDRPRMILGVIVDYLSAIQQPSNAAKKGEAKKKND